MDLARIFSIAALAPIGGISAYLVAEALSPESGGSSPLAVWAVVLFIVWLVSTSIAFTIGLLLHLAIRHRQAPSIAILLLFLLPAAAITWLISQDPGFSRRLQLIGLGTAICSWAFYCYGPLRVRRLPTESQ